MAMQSSDRAESIRARARQEWTQRVPRYAERNADQTARLATALVEAVGPPPGGAVLDVATGPGVAAVAAASAIGPRGRVVASDLVPAWAPVVAERARAAGVENVTFREMGAEALDLLDGSFDAVLCQLGLMLVPDPVRALREMWRVLKPGGRLGVAVWSTADRVPIFGLTSQVFGHLMPPPTPGEPGPLSLGQPGLLERHLADAGFPDAVVVRRTADFEVDDPDELWRQRVEEPPLRESVAALGLDEPDALHRRLLAALEPYRRGAGVVLPNELLLATATR